MSGREGLDVYLMYYTHTDVSQCIILLHYDNNVMLNNCVIIENNWITQPIKEENNRSSGHL